MNSSFSMMIVIAIGVMVLVISSYLVYITASPEATTIDKTSAISKCDDLCLNDQTKGVVNLNGVCAYNPNYKLLQANFSIEGTESNCLDISSCSMFSIDGRCTVNEITYDNEKTCEYACSIDGGEYGGSTGNNPTSMSTMCKIYKTNDVVCSKDCVKGNQIFDTSKC